ncbi:MAG: DHH family phosphoesterase [Candidatus Caldatribacteriaceae bacterium]
MSREIDPVIQTIKSHRRFVVTSHQNIDGDGVGAIVAFSSLLLTLQKDVIMVNNGKVPYFYRFLPKTSEIISYEDFQKTYPRGNYSPEALVVIDCSNLDRLGKMSRIAQDIPLVVNIDHHPDNSLFGHVNWVIPEVSSTILIYTLFKEMKIPLDKEASSSILNGIISDTGGFSFAEVDSRMLVILEELVSQGASVAEIMRHNFRFRRLESLKLLGKALERLSYDPELGIAFTYLVQGDFREFHSRTEDAEGIVDHGLYIPGAKIAILFRETEEKVFKVSLRAQGEYEVLSIAHHFGGGGHLKAAGFKIVGERREIMQKVLDFVQNKFYETRTAVQ